MISTGSRPVDAQRAGEQPVLVKITFDRVIGIFEVVGTPEVRVRVDDVTWRGTVVSNKLCREVRAVCLRENRVRETKQEPLELADRELVNLRIPRISMTASTSSDTGVTMKAVPGSLAKFGSLSFRYLRGSNSR